MTARRHLTGLALIVAACGLSLAATLLVAPAPGHTTPAVESLSPLAAADEGDEYGRLMLVLDSSGSMAQRTSAGQTKIEAAKSALRDVISELPADALVGLRVFGAEVFSRKDAGACEDSQNVVPLGTDNRDQLLGAIDGYQPYGETPIPVALQQAAKDLGDEGTRSIMLVSDGESTCAPDPCQVAADLVEQGIDLHIDVVGLSVSGAARAQLQCVADRGQGTYYDAEDAEDITDQISRVAERAIRPFTLSGEPITGGPETAPEPVTLGDWQDTLGPNGDPAGTKNYVWERATAGTTLRVSAISQGRAGDDGLRVKVFGPDGALCDQGTTIRQLDARDVVGVQAIAAEESECDQPGAYRISVERLLNKQGRVPFGLRLSEEPPIVDPGFAGDDSDIDVVAPETRGKATRVIGGAGFANAGELAPGRSTSTIVPGEALVFKFHLDHGQSARVGVTFPEASPAMREVIGMFAPLSQITLYNPMQAVLERVRGGEYSGAAGDEELALMTATPSVSRELMDLNGFNGVADYSTAGDYYLAVSLMRQDYTIEFPVRIGLEIIGEPSQGPTYADGVTWSVADGASEPTGGEEPDPTPGTEEREEGDDPGVSIAVLVAGLFGVAALAAGLVLWRRRT